MAATEQRLCVFLNETLMGNVIRAKGGQLSFRYEHAYLEKKDAVPLSLSMPLDGRTYSHEFVHPWLWGLLPDNELVLARWARRFQVSASNCFGLLQGMGEDCAGAIRFIQPDATDRIDRGGREPISEEEIGRRLRLLRTFQSIGREPDDRGQFSLAGAQSKTALQRKGSRWYIPWGREPTTHILKPPRADIPGHAENEHFCLRLATELGLSVARGEILSFDGEPAIVIERYDRLELGNRLIRVHQEDICQALGVHPARKYQQDGGPDIVAIMALMNRSSQAIEDRRRIMEAVAFNYLILGTDAHAKNFSLLLGQNQQVRLARLYDITSFLPYFSRRKDCRFAMKIGGYYIDQQIKPRHFERLARGCEFRASDLFQIVLDQSARIPHTAEKVIAEMAEKGIADPVLEVLADQIRERATRVREEFGATTDGR